LAVRAGVFASKRDNEDVETSESCDLFKLRSQLQCQQLQWKLVTLFGDEVFTSEIKVIFIVRGKFVPHQLAQSLGVDDKILSNLVGKNVSVVVETIESKI
jgi:hypothetical protein